MKLKTFINFECCNYVRSECIGVSFTGMFRTDGICGVLLKEDPEECHFFKKAVLPLSKYKGCHIEITNEYSKIDKKVKKAKKRFCSCGVSLDKGERFCGKCKRGKTKKANRKNYIKVKGSIQ